LLAPLGGGSGCARLVSAWSNTRHWLK